MRRAIVFGYVPVVTSQTTEVQWLAAIPVMLGITGEFVRLLPIYQRKIAAIFIRFLGFSNVTYCFRCSSLFSSKSVWKNKALCSTVSWTKVTKIEDIPHGISGACSSKVGGRVFSGATRLIFPIPTNAKKNALIDFLVVLYPNQTVFVYMKYFWRAPEQSAMSGLCH